MTQQSFTVAAIVVITFALGFATGRASAPEPAAPAAIVAPSGVAAPTAATPFPTASAFPSAPAPGAAQPAAPFAGEGEVAGEPEPSSNVAGTVAEVIQVPNYTYLRINTGRGDEWAAVSANSQLQVGQKVALGHATQMEK